MVFRIFLLLLIVLFTPACKGVGKMSPEDCRSLLGPHIYETESHDGSLKMLSRLAETQAQCKGSGYFELISAKAHLAIGKYDEAEKELLQAEKIGGFSIAAVNETFLGIVVGQKSIEKAYSRAGMQIKNPETAGAGFLLQGGAYAADGKIDQAIVSMEKARGLGQELSANTTLVALYFQSRKYKEAARSFDAADATLKHNDVLYKTTLNDTAPLAAFSNYLIGNHKRSKEIIERYLKYHPKSAEDKKIAYLLEQLSSPSNVK